MIFSGKCNLDLQIECLRRLPYLPRLVLSLLIVRVNKHADNTGTRRQFVEYAEPLCLRRSSQQADACSISARSAKASDQPHFDGVTPGREHDWYRGCGSFRCQYGWFAPSCNQHRDPAANEFRCKRGKTIILALGPTVFDRDVLPLDVSVSLKASAERINQMSGIIKRPATQKPN